MEFKKLFLVEKPIIGMIHLAGEKSERVKRALEELTIYEEQGIDGAIIEDYHGNCEDVYQTLMQSSKLKLKLIRGVNVLLDPYMSFGFAGESGAKFVQFDSVQKKDLWLFRYNKLRQNYPEITVLGGVGFKYKSPPTNLAQALDGGKFRSDAIVTTGEGTNIETPTKKLIEYKKILKDFPLIVGAGVNQDNVYEQLKIADGAIIGSSFKIDNSTYNQLDIQKIKDVMDVVKELR